MQHDITITIPNSAAGTVPGRDGVMGMILKGVAIGSTLALDTPYLLTQLSDATALGISAANDAANNIAVFQQISEFYGQAGPGGLLWIQVTAVGNAFATYAASAAFSQFITYTTQADVTLLPKIIGFCYDVPQATQSAADFPADVPAAVTALQTVQKQFFARGACFGVIVDGYNMSSTVTPGTLGSQATNTAYAVSLCITGTKGNGVSAVGLALGKFSRISIGQGFGAVEDGAINTTTAYLTNGILITSAGLLTVGNTVVVQGGTVTYNSVLYNAGQSFTVINGHTSFTTTNGGYVLYNSTPVVPPNTPNSPVAGLDLDDIGLLGSKQYMFITKVDGITGLFWNDGATCTAPTNFFSSMEYTRVANSLSYDARQFFTQLRGKTLPTDVSTGNLSSTFCVLKSKSFETTFIDPLGPGGTNDISGGSLLVAGPNFAVVSQLNFTLTLVRQTVLGNVVGTLEFAATL